MLLGTYSACACSISRSHRHCVASPCLLSRNRLRLLMHSFRELAQQLLRAHARFHMCMAQHGTRRTSWHLHAASSGGPHAVLSSQETRAHAGAIVPILSCLAERQETLLSERFHLGGIASMRGFLFKGVGDRAARRTEGGSTTADGGTDAIGGDLFARVRASVRPLLHPHLQRSACACLVACGSRCMCVLRLPRNTWLHACARLRRGRGGGGVASGGASRCTRGAAECAQCDLPRFLGGREGDRTAVSRWVSDSCGGVVNARESVS